MQNFFFVFDQWAICCWWNYWRCYKFTDFFLFVFYWQKIVNYMNNNPLLFRQWSLSNIMQLVFASTNVSSRYLLKENYLYDVQGRLMFKILFKTEEFSEFFENYPSKVLSDVLKFPQKFFNDRLNFQVMGSHFPEKNIEFQRFFSLLNTSQHPITLYDHATFIFHFDIYLFSRFS